MGEPGALLPADVLSAKDGSFKSYPPKLSKLPTLQATNENEVACSKPNLLSGQSSAGQNSLSSGKDSKMTELLPSLHSGKMGTGVSSFGLNKTVPSGNQMDHIPSLAIGTSLYKGGRGPNISDGARMSVNLVPYSQNNSEDPKNLYADLNPFQIKGSDKASLQGNHGRKTFNELQQPKYNLTSGRPPVPLVQKNSPIYKKDEYDFVDSLFAKSNHAAGDQSMLSTPSTSSTASGKSKSYNTYGEDDATTSAGNKLASAEGEFNRLSIEDDQGIDQKVTYQISGEVLPNDESNVPKEYGKAVSRIHDHRNNQQDGFTGINLRFRDQGNSSSSLDLSVPQVDPVIDDVSECEIPWEDLVIGERIGLGIYLGPPALHYKAFYTPRHFTIVDTFQIDINNYWA